jgi:hypothetical protein
MDHEAKTLLARNTDAVILQSATGERVADALGRLDARLALSQSAGIAHRWLALAGMLITTAALVGSYFGARSAPVPKHTLEAACASR